ncbi:hypothetical protein L484_023503 [Morus notabilis]|uniref:Phylloplanin n=1 Tax=Morus notabilis TaxID=981085 RepID=W9REW7_9ROSA|nr:phylloplanin [Morus notabilis]EXB74761.1 hypothetical protein L484_023503 [Morus notabilis]
MAMEKSLVFVMCMLVAAIVAAPMAEAQLGNIIGNLLSLVNIQGIVYCTANGRIGVNGTSTPVFPNALVQLQCGNGNVVSSTTTNGSGLFSILMDPLKLILSTLLQDCKLVVATPLSNCNAGLPSDGSLISPLKLLGNIVSGLLNITNIGPSGFNFFSS